MTSFLLTKAPGTLPPGVEATKIDKIGYHGISTSALTLEAVRVPPTPLRLTTIFAGTSEIQRTIIADDLLDERRRG